MPPTAIQRFRVARPDAAIELDTCDLQQLDLIFASARVSPRSGSGVRITAPAHQYSDPRVSPDGRRIAVHVFEEERDNWILHLRSGAFMRLTFDRTSVSREIVRTGEGQELQDTLSDLRRAVGAAEAAIAR